MSTSKYERIEDIPEVGPAAAAKLKELGFSMVESLAIATINELVAAGVGEKQAAKIIEMARSSITVKITDGGVEEVVEEE